MTGAILDRSRCRAAELAVDLDPKAGALVAGCV
jgi:hypothetical protein